MSTIGLTRYGLLLFGAWRADLSGSDGGMGPSECGDPRVAHH